MDMSWHAGIVLMRACFLLYVSLERKMDHMKKSENVTLEAPTIWMCFWSVSSGHVRLSWIPTLYIIIHHTSSCTWYAWRTGFYHVYSRCLFVFPMMQTKPPHREAVVPKPMSTCQRHSFMSKCWERKGISPWKTKILNPKGMEVWFRWCSFSIGWFLGVHWFAVEYPSWN